MRIRLSRIVVMLTFFGVALTTTGVYASWNYLEGGIQNDDGSLGVDVNEFEYPEFTVNFYTGSSVSGKYGGARTLVASHTYNSYTEEFTFPGNIGKHPDTTLSYWCTQPLYYFENDVEVYENGSATPATLDDVLGDLYNPEQTYKIEDIAWKADNTLDLYEIVEENYVFVGPQIEKIKYGECDPYQKHINTSFLSEPSYPFPHCDVIVSVGGRTWNNESVKGDAFGFSLLYADLASGFANNHQDIVTGHTISATSYLGADKTYRLVKQLPAVTGNRVTQDSDRDFGFVDSSAKTVETYDTSNPFKIYVSPGMFLDFSIKDEETVRGVYSKPLAATETHANCTFIHYRIGDVIVGEKYNTTDSPSKHLDVNNFYAEDANRNYSWRWAEDYDYDDCICAVHVGGTSDGGCLLEDTPILTADGTYVPIQEIDPGDMVMSYDHLTGEFVKTPIISVAHKDEGYINMVVTELLFNDGSTLDIAHNHALFDLTDNKYAVLDQYNAEDYIGHKFYSLEKGELTLIATRNYTDTVKVYVPFTKDNINCVADGFLTNPGVYAKFLMNIFEFEEDMRIDAESMQRDIDTYGLFTYQNLAPFVSELVFNELHLQYLKIGLGKEQYTMAEVIENLNIYKKYFD